MKQIRDSVKIFNTIAKVSIHSRDDDSFIFTRESLSNLEYSFSGITIYRTMLNENSQAFVVSAPSVTSDEIYHAIQSALREMSRNVYDITILWIVKSHNIFWKYDFKWDDDADREGINPIRRYAQATKIFLVSTILRNEKRDDTYRSLFLVCAYRNIFDNFNSDFRVFPLASEKID